MELTKKSCLITGGSGFIGMHLIECILSKNLFEKIFIIDIKPPDIKHENITFISLDIRKQNNISLAENIEVCFHLAAVAKEPGFEWEEYYNTNYLGTKNVIKICENNNIKTIIFTSTMMVYKAKEYQFCEDDLTTPCTAYGISKLLAEETLLAWLNKANERHLTIFRVGVVFGKNENGNYTRLFKAIKKKYFFYIGKKSTVKSSIYVKDVVNALIFSNQNKLEDSIYNLAIPTELTIENIVNAIKKVFHFKSTTFIVPYKIALLGGYFFETLNLFGLKTNIHHRRIQKLFYSTNISSNNLVEQGFKFNYTLEEAIEDWKKDCNNNDLF